MKIRALILCFFAVIFLFGCNGPAAVKEINSAKNAVSDTEQITASLSTGLTDASKPGETTADATQKVSEKISETGKNETAAGETSSKLSTTKPTTLATKPITTVKSSITTTAKSTSTTKLASTTKPVTTTNPVTTKAETTTKIVTTTKVETTTALTTIAETTSTTTKAVTTTTTTPATTKAVTTAPPTTAAGGTVKLYIGCITAVNYGIRNQAGYDQIVPADGIMLNTDADLQQDDTVLSLLARVLKENSILLVNQRGYISNIGGLKDKVCGPTSGWLYSVNGVFPKYGCDQYNLKSGDKIKILYTVTNGDVTDLSGWN